MPEHLSVDSDVCIGAGLCVLAQPSVFDQDDDGIVLVLVESPPVEDDVRRAVATCPSGALSLRADGSL
ncbi:ferredoxin [Micromonospora sp. NPDC049102]|uniref:ferredoxin n=1 Tax=Micromonospora sp. NPDC049102 TaxID=3364265 RepID=UPI003724530B